MNWQCLICGSISGDLDEIPLAQRKSPTCISNPKTSLSLHKFALYPPTRPHPLLYHWPRHHRLSDVRRKIVPLSGKKVATFGSSQHGYHCCNGEKVCLFSSECYFDNMNDSSFLLHRMVFPTHSLHFSPSVYHISPLDSHAAHPWCVSWPLWLCVYRGPLPFGQAIRLGSKAGKMSEKFRLILAKVCGKFKEHQTFSFLWFIASAIWPLLLTPLSYPVLKMSLRVSWNLSKFFMQKVFYKYILVRF